jgi:serine/threonine protein kinase
VKSFKKSFRPNLSPEQRADEYFCQLESLKDEKKIMSSMGQHPNLLRLIGAITTNIDDYRVIIEYCEYGSLEIFLREKEKEGKFVNEYIVTSNDDYQLIQSEYHWTVGFFAQVMKSAKNCCIGIS